MADTLRSKDILVQSKKWNSQTYLGRRKTLIKLEFGKTIKF